jgi:TolB protein
MEARLLLSAAVAAGLTQLLTGCGGSAALGPDLVFVSSRDGRYAIYAMSSDGAHQVRLTKRLATDGDVLSAERVFFQVDPAWSPDGREIAFASKRRGTFDVYVMNADGTGTRLLAATSEDESHPTWSPGGTQLAFERGDRGDIYVMEADGTRVRRVTQDPEQEIHPAWSPDGRWIAFVRRRPETRIAELWLVRPDGSRRHLLTLLRAGSLSPAWSPDGRWIAFSTNAGGTRFEIYRIGVNGKGLRRVTHSSEDAFEPAWSPDGRTIAFSRGGSIVITDLNGNEEQLTASENNDSSPTWNSAPPASD